jgi:epoxyqueuosine reductase QueG
MEPKCRLVAIELLPRTTSKFGYFKISKYAYGADYHFVIKEKLKEFLFSIQSTIGEVSGRAFVDSAPVLDKAWAAKEWLRLDWEK